MPGPSRVELGKNISDLVLMEGCILLCTYFSSTKCHLRNTKCIPLILKPCKNDQKLCKLSNFENHNFKTHKLEEKEVEGSWEILNYTQNLTSAGG